MIKPTIFVGLGTTGTDILKQLRQLMSEEFENFGLPIFRFISIETRDEETGDNPRHFKNYEEIKVVNATIESTDPVKLKLDPDHPTHNEHLTEWLNPPILDHIKSYSDGARNLRMAGRLCLWENWTDVQNAFDNALNAVIGQDNQHETRQILTQNYNTRNLEVPNELVDPTGINAYVVGSLCGGSCSGMLIDTAYYLRNLLSGTANDISGIFTMYDRSLATRTASEHAMHAANCYASLSELNYYNHEDTVYNVTFPDNQNVTNKQIPFDYAMYVSPTGKLPAIRFVVGEVVDVEALNLMVALNLFAESVGDTDGEKNKIRTDWVTYSGYGGMKPVRRGETPTMVRSMASFGLTAVWYPKYRIASAASCLASKNLCQNWMKGPGEEGHKDGAAINAEATEVWNSIKAKKNILTESRVKGEQALGNEIESILNSVTQRFGRITSHDTLRDEMHVCPRTKADIPTPFNTRFNQGGKYYEWIRAKVDDCKKVFCNAIDDIFESQINSVDFQGTYGLAGVRTFFERLDQIIGQEQRRCLSDPPTLNLAQLDFEPMNRANNFWTIIAGTSEEAVREHRDRLIQEFKQLVTKTARDLQDYFLREVLEAVREKLGFEVYGDGPTINKQLTQIDSNLNDCILALQQEYDAEIVPPTYRCVKIVTNNPRDSIQEDAEALSDQIINAISSTNLLGENANEITMSDFLRKGHTDITQLVTETYQRLALREINSGAGQLEGLVVTKARQILNDGGDDISDLARRSNPYQNFTNEYQPFNISERGGPKIIFGHDSSETNDSLNDLQNRLGFRRSGNSTVDHLLFFYEEEASFALDDLAAYNALKQHFEGSEAPHGYWTHQDPNFYDITLAEKRGKLERWCRAMSELVPKIRNINSQAFSDVFETNKDDIIIYKYRIGVVTNRLRMADDKTGRDTLCRQENEVAFNKFFVSVRDGFNKLKQESVTQAIDVLIDQIADPDEQHNLAEEYKTFLQEVNPDFEEKAIQEKQDSEPINELSFEERIQQIKSKPEKDWNADERLLMQAHQQPSGSADSTGVSTGRNTVIEEISNSQDDKPSYDE